MHVPCKGYYAEIFDGKVRCYSCGSFASEDALFTAALVGAYIPVRSTATEEEVGGIGCPSMGWWEREWATRSRAMGEEE